MEEVRVNSVCLPKGAPEGRLSLTVGSITKEPESWEELALRGSELRGV